MSVIATGALDRTAILRRYVAHGLELVCDFPIPHAPSYEGVGSSLRTVRATAELRAGVEELWQGQSSAVVHETVLSDGIPLRVEEGTYGEHLIRYGDHLFHLSSDFETLSCTPPTDGDPRWYRVLHDWVTYFASALFGIDAIHASAVRLDLGVVAFAAATGAGKTTLAAEFLARGAEFVCDDVLSLEKSGDVVLAYPGAPFINLDIRRRRIAQAIGKRVSTFGNEIWLSPSRLAMEPAPVVAVVVLERRPTGPASPTLSLDGYMTLRALAVGLPHLRGYEQQRFAVLGTLAESAQLLRLQASSLIPPDALAGQIEAHLRGCG